LDGFFGKFLDVDLSDRKIDDYPLKEKWLDKYIGGRGIAGKIISEELKQGADPLGPENIIIFGTGPLQGTGIPGAGRHVVMAKSPKTGAVSDSFAGGFFAHEIGKSGYDGIIIRGTAETPKYVSLRNGEAEINDANDLWGIGVADVDQKLKERHDGGRVSSIGIGGENLVRFACIINDRNRAAGRPGFGAVMGSKKLKAVHVKGKMDKEIQNKKKFEKNRKKLIEKLETMIQWGKYGTAGGVQPFNEMNTLPTKNFQKGKFDGAGDISGERMYEDILEERDTCAGCPIRCKRVVKTSFSGNDVEEKYGGPEYETVAALGSFCLNDNLDSIALANQKCNKYGLDTISVGVIIAYLMEASEKDLIDHDITWGDADAIIELIDKIAHREDIGDFLAQGIDKVAEDIGGDFAMEVKNQEIPMHDPRAKKSLALSYATSPRGATHLEVVQDLFDENPEELDIEVEINRHDLENKPEFCKVYEDLVSFSNSAITCAYVSWVSFIEGGYTYPEIRGLIESVTGMEVTAEKMMEVGERNFNLLKALTIRDGLDSKDDYLPDRFQNPIPEGDPVKEKIPKEDLEDKIYEYYKIRGWDGDGRLTEKKLKELGLEDIA